jgi:hypothetical protein
MMKYMKNVHMFQKPIHIRMIVFFKGEETIDERMEMLLKEAKTPLFEACGQRKNSHLSCVDAPYCLHHSPSD